MECIVITGGTGMIGQALTGYFIAEGYKVIILTRHPEKYPKASSPEYAAWDVKKGMLDKQALSKADYIIHLAGANVMEKRWSDSYKKEMLESRTKSAQLIAEALLENPGQVKAVISSSAIGWYGEDRQPGHSFTENDPADSSFLGDTCRQWEEGFRSLENSIRVCKIRTGIVLGREGGLIKEFMLPIRFGVAPIPGSGRQISSWIHITDLCRIFHFAIKNNITGSYNAVGPNPVPLKEISLKLGEKTRGKFIIPLHAPSVFLKLLLGERAVEILKSATVSSKKISALGFSFLYPTIDAALSDITRKL